MSTYLPLIMAWALPPRKRMGYGQSVARPGINDLKITEVKYDLYNVKIVTRRTPTLDGQAAWYHKWHNKRGHVQTLYTLNCAVRGGKHCFSHNTHHFRMIESSLIGIEGIQRYPFGY